MAIELTTADKSTRANLLSAINQGITGLPFLDGSTTYADKAEVVWTTDAVEGTIVPDADGTSFTKTFALTKNYPNGAFIFCGSSINTVLGQNSGVPFPKLYLASLNFNLSAANPISNMGIFSDANPEKFRMPLIGSSYITTTTLLYVNNDYTQARKLSFGENNPNFPTPLDKDKNLITELGYGKTYTELNNTLVGYYAGPFGGGPDDSYFTVNSNQSVGRFAVESVYIQNNNLIFKCKKTWENDSGNPINITRRAILVVDANI